MSLAARSISGFGVLEFGVGAFFCGKVVDGAAVLLCFEGNGTVFFCAEDEGTKSSTAGFNEEGMSMGIFNFD